MDNSLLFCALKIQFLRVTLKFSMSLVLRAIYREIVSILCGCHLKWVRHSVADLAFSTFVATTALNS